MRDIAAVVITDDDEVRCLIDGRDFRRWEAEHDKSSLGVGLSQRMLLELSFYALHRSGSELVRGVDLDGYGDLVKWVVDDPGSEVPEEPARPTRRARGGGRS